MGITRWAWGQHATTAALLIAIVASILTRYARASTRYSMHKRGHHEHLHGGHQSVAAGWSTYTTTRLLSGYALYNWFNNYPLNKVTKLISNVFWNTTADAVSNLKRAFRRKKKKFSAFFQIFFQLNVDLIVDMKKHRLSPLLLPNTPGWSCELDQSGLPAGWTVYSI